MRFGERRIRMRHRTMPMRARDAKQRQHDAGTPNGE